MEKETKDVLAKKAEEAFEEIKFSENEHIQLELLNAFLKRFESSSAATPDINIIYALDIYLLSFKLMRQKSSAEAKVLSLKFYNDAKEKYKKIKDFDDRFCDNIMLSSFLSLISNALILNVDDEIDTSTLNEMKNYAEEVYKKFRTRKDRIEIVKYLSILLHISKKELNYNLQFESTLKEGIKVINNFKEVSPDVTEELTREFIIKLTKAKERIGVEDSDESKLLGIWLQIFKDNNTEEQTKLEVLKDILAKYKDNVVVTEKISTIYYNIQKIKFLLVVEDFKGLQFGHYTNGEVLQILLNTKEEISEDKEFEITGKTRLYNVAYMNDPEEGKILDILLGFNKSISLEDKVTSSPWFLMSLTNAIDELAMWSQYGNNAEGVCLELKPDSFLEVKSKKDLEWLTSDQENTSKSKDCLYRICYLDEESLKKCEIKIKKEDNELLKYKTDAIVKESIYSTIEDSLKEIKEAINDVLKDSPVEELREEELREGLNKLLEEIRYLFKSSAYSYEKELRLLKYSALSSNNKKIKVDKVKPAAKLYIERETTIELKRIIFGPKYNKPEDVVPLVNLLDENIKCERSSKKFK